MNRPIFGSFARRLVCRRNGHKGSGAQSKRPDRYISINIDALLIIKRQFRLNTDKYKFYCRLWRIEEFRKIVLILIILFICFPLIFIINMRFVYFKEFLKLFFSHLLLDVYWSGNSVRYFDASKRRSPLSTRGFRVDFGFSSDVIIQWDSYRNRWELLSYSKMFCWKCPFLVVIIFTCIYQSIFGLVFLSVCFPGESSLGRRWLLIWTLLRDRANSGSCFGFRLPYTFPITPLFDRIS